MRYDPYGRAADARALGLTGVGTINSSLFADKTCIREERVEGTQLDDRWLTPGSRRVVPMFSRSNAGIRERPGLRGKFPMLR